MSWACILLPQLALDGVLRRHPQPERPLALVTGPAQKRVLAAVNPAAARLGLHAGQALAAAHALSSGFATLEYDPDDVARSRDFLAAWAYRYSSQVGAVAFNGMAEDAIVLEIGASLRLFGPWPRFERQLREDLTALGFTHRIAVAPNARAAWVLAGTHDGLALTQPSTLHTALARIQVAHARLDARTAQALHAMGLRRLGQLFAAPRASLAQRFGNRLLEHLDRLRGDAPDPFPLYRPPDRFDLRLELPYEIEHSQALLFPVRRMTADLGAFLAGRDGGVQRFVLRLEHEDHPDTEVLVGMLAPNANRRCCSNSPAGAWSRRAFPRRCAACAWSRKNCRRSCRPDAICSTNAPRRRCRGRYCANACAHGWATTPYTPSHPRRTIARNGPGAGHVPADDAGNGTGTASELAAATPIPLRDSTLAHPRGPRTHRKRLVGRRRCAPGLLRRRNLQGQRAWTYLRRGRHVCNDGGAVGHFMLHGWFA